MLFRSRLDIDRFSNNGTRVLGVDIRGRILEVKRFDSGVCKIETFARLKEPFQDKDITGLVEEVVYYYEPVLLCAYRQPVDARYADQRRVRRVCYQPLGVVNKLAPYTSP